MFPDPSMLTAPSCIFMHPYPIPIFHVEHTQSYKMSFTKNSSLFPSFASSSALPCHWQPSQLRKGIKFERERACILMPASGPYTHTRQSFLSSSDPQKGSRLCHSNSFFVYCRLLLIHICSCTKRAFITLRTKFLHPSVLKFFFRLSLTSP